MTATIDGEPVAVRQCWCRQCRQIAAGSPTTNAMFAAADVTIAGELARYEYVAASGNLLTQSFCPGCGTPVMAQSSARPQIRTLRVGFPRRAQRHRAADGDLAGGCARLGLHRCEARAARGPAAGTDTLSGRWRAGGKRWLIAAAAGGALAICAGAALAPGSFDERLGLATRLTARWSVLWFLAAFVAQPLHRIYGGFWTWLLRQRRYVGLGFAAAHTIHGASFVWQLSATDTTRPLVVYIVGGAGYVLMFAMAATSNDASMRALGRNWKRLHTTGIWLIWFIFTVSYSGRIFKPGTLLLGGVMTALLAAAALIRIPAVRRLLGAR
ncbi:MAG: GFA family protein [Sphingomonas sp.]